MKKAIIVIFAILVAVSSLLGIFVAVASKVALLDIFLTLAPTAPIMPQANVLLLGIDDAFGHRSDTIMVLHTDPEKKTASLLSIPRDTLAVLPGRGLDKINHAYAYGGIELSRATVEGLLGINLPYYIIVNLSGITQIIDELGGITIDVEKDMYYVDNAGDLYIDLRPGVQTLNGKQAMGYLRYRRDGGDLTRIDRQQKFLKALGEEMMKRENLLRSPKLFLNLLSYLETNMDSRKVISLSLGLRSAFEMNNLHFNTIPGYDMMVDGIYYMKPDLDRMREIVRDMLKKESAVSQADGGGQD